MAALKKSAARDGELRRFSLRRAAGKMGARKRSDLTRKASGVDGPDLNETYRESITEAADADAAPKPPRQNRPKPSCVGRVSGMKAWPQPYTNRVCVLVCDLLLAGLLGGAGAWLYIASQAHASSGLIHYACADSLANPRTCACVLTCTIPTVIL